MKKPLTDTLIRTIAAPASGRVEISDERCSGLAFRVTASGVRSWSFRFRCPRSNGLTRATLGTYPFGQGTFDIKQINTGMKKRHYIQPNATA